MVGNRLMMVLVLYNQSWNELASRTVLETFLKEKSGHLFVYDNSLAAQNISFFSSEKISYVHDAANPGLAKAYNAALNLAVQRKDQYLLLLDQDTKFELDFLETLTDFSNETEVAAIFPKIYSQDQMISPFFADQYIRLSNEIPAVGLTDQAVMAINSGTALSVKALQKIGGFNEEFPLDYLDHWLFWRLSKENSYFYILPDHLTHDLSVLDYSQVSLERYQSILEAEYRYYTRYNRSLFPAYRKQLNRRILKQLVRVSNKQILKATLAQIRKLKQGD